MEFDALIVGGGAAGMSCALVLGSAWERPYCRDKKVGIILHQKTSHLQNAVFNNVLGIPAGTTGMSILEQGKLQLTTNYPKVVQIEKEKVLEISFSSEGIRVRTNKNSYLAGKVVIAVGYSDLMNIKGLEHYRMPHEKSPAAKNRIMLRNKDHLIAPNLYVAGSLAGHRSQFSIACGSGAAVATDILTEWNDGVPSMVHDKLK